MKKIISILSMLLIASSLVFAGLNEWTKSDEIGTDIFGQEVHTYTYTATENNQYIDSPRIVFKNDVEAELTMTVYYCREFDSYSAEFEVALTKNDEKFIMFSEDLRFEISQYGKVTDNPVGEASKEDNGNVRIDFVESRDVFDFINHHPLERFRFTFASKDNLDEYLSFDVSGIEVNL